MYYGDIRLGDTLDFKFTTRRFNTGAPFTLGGSPAVAAYVDNGTTEITAGITLTTDFDSRTGLNHVRVVATSGNGFAAGTNVQVVITAGTVDGVSVVGEVVGSFSIEDRAAFNVLAAATNTEIGQVAPSATATLRDMIKWMYKLSRNRITATATQINVYDDSGATVDNKATVSDNGTTFERAEFGAGP